MDRDEMVQKLIAAEAVNVAEVWLIEDDELSRLMVRHNLM